MKEIKIYSTPAPPLNGEDIRKETNPLRIAAKKMKVGQNIIVKDVGTATRFVGYLKDIGFTGTMKRLEDGSRRVWKMKASK